MSSENISDKFVEFLLTSGICDLELYGYEPFDWYTEKLGGKFPTITTATVKGGHFHLLSVYQQRTKNQIVLNVDSLLSGFRQMLSKYKDTDYASVIALFLISGDWSKTDLHADIIKSIIRYVAHQDTRLKLISHIFMQAGTSAVFNIEAALVALMTKFDKVSKKSLPY